MTSPFDLLNDSEKDQVIAMVVEEEKLRGGKYMRWKAKEKKKNEYAKALLAKKSFDTLLSNRAFAPSITANGGSMVTIGSSYGGTVASSGSNVMVGRSNGKGSFTLNQFIKDVQERDAKEFASKKHEAVPEDVDEQPPAKRFRKEPSAERFCEDKCRDDADKEPSAERFRDAEEPHAKRVRWAEGVVFPEKKAGKQSKTREQLCNIKKGLLRQLRKVREERAQRISHLESENMHLESKIFSLRGERNKARDAADEAWGVVDRIRRDRNHLDSENECLVGENEHLVSENEHLVSENERLRNQAHCGGVHDSLW